MFGFYGELLSRFRTRVVMVHESATDSYRGATAMASGKSLTLRYNQRTKKKEALPKGASRDRALSGKARVKARREENRLQRESKRA